MNEKKFYVMKESGTYSNALEAYGVTELLARINSLGSKLLIEDKAQYYEITLLNPQTEITTYFDLFPYIKTKEKKGKKKEEKNKKPDSEEVEQEVSKDMPVMESEIQNYIDYEEEKLKKERYNEFVKSILTQKRELRKQNNAEFAKLISALDKKITEYEEKPRDDWDIISGINLLKAMDTYKKIYFNLHKNKKEFLKLLNLIFELYGSFEDSTDTIKQKLNKLKRSKTIVSVKDTDCLQIFNPSMVKGAHSPKPNSITPKPKDGFWLKECMKIIGSYNGMIIKNIKVSKKTLDTKAYVIDINKIEWDKRRTIFKELKSALKGITSIRLDINSILIVTKRLIENHSEFVERRKVFLKKYRPKNEIKGLYIAYFKNMGNASSPSNISYLELPEFIEIDSFERANTWLDIIDEHLSIIRGTKISADRTDESGSILSILQEYRQFLTTGDIDCFFKFISLYSIFLMQQIAKGNYYTRPFKTKLMEVFLMEMDKKFGNILKNQGFRNISRAIRKSTISEQYAKSRGEQLYEIKYGLAQDLIRKSDYEEELIAFLSEFIVSYNQETAKFAEKNKDKDKLRPTIKQQDIDDLISLIDEYGSSIVGRLLCAYGYTLERRSEEPGDNEQDSVEDEQDLDEDVQD